MSAIFGILNHHAHPVKQSDLQKMCIAMSHRGLDDRGFWQQDSIGLGHGMFRTTPESTLEKLPFLDMKSGLVITADSRIDNREALAKRLGLSRTTKDEMPDSHFILSAYKKWGDQCVNHLLGDFSFAIWNERDKHLFCARDHMGVKPFIYFVSHNTFVFASEVQAVLKASGVSQKRNEGRIADFLVPELEGIDKTSTFFEEIYRLPPAHSLLVENGKVSKNCYWRPDPEKKISFSSDEEYVSAFTEIYTDAIDKRLRGNDDVASMLSGGLDSSSIVGIARNIHRSRTGKPFPVFSATSPNNPACRETYFINSVLQQGGLIARTISADEMSYFNKEINRVVLTEQEPFDPMIMIIAVYLLANKSGYRVMLDGIDGDIVASLSSSYPTILLKNGKYHDAVREIFLQNKNYYGGKLSTSKILYQNIRAAYTPLILRKLRTIWRKRRHMEQHNSNSIINMEFAKEIHLTDRLAQLRAHGSNGFCQSTYTQHISALQHPYLTVGIERYSRIASLCGIEPRHPLLDKRLVDFMTAIPWNQKFRSGWNKYLLRKSSEPTLPQEVCWRKGWEHLGWD